MTKLTVTYRNLVKELENDYFKLLPGSSCAVRYKCPILANKLSVCVGTHKILVTIANMRFHETHYFVGGGGGLPFAGVQKGGG